MHGKDAAHEPDLAPRLAAHPQPSQVHAPLLRLARPRGSRNTKPRLRSGGFGRIHAGICAAALGGILALIATPAEAVPPPNERMDGDRRADAALRDIFFADPDRGWAVGDLGTIVVTSDGGNVWVPQTSGTSGNLQSVCFSTPERGFAVGGWYESDTGLGRGILLRTRDGGQTWKTLETDLPPLHSIRQLASGSLVAVGDWSPIHLGGVFVSEDEGVSWRALGGEQIRQVTAAGIGPDGVLVADDQGVLFATARAAVAPEAVATLADVHALATAGPHAAAALADRTFAVSRDAGRSWARLEPGAAVNRPGTEGSTSHFLPLCTAAAADGSLWFGGAPGRFVWRVDPQGVLSQHETGFDGPIYALHFRDQHRGWAVGGFGSILATRDGGRTWRVQRGAAARAMLLGVAVDPAELPWPVLASEALELGNRFVVAVAEPSSRPRLGSRPRPTDGPTLPGHSAAGDQRVGRRPEAFDPLQRSLGGRTSHVASRLGGGEVLRWNSADENAESIAAVIASTAPSVVILGSDLSEAERERWLSQAVRAGVARVFEVSGESRAELTIHASAVLPVAGVITADLWSDALALLDPRRAVPERLFLHRRWDESHSDRLAGGVSDGLASSGGRRPIPDGRRRNFQVLQARSGESQLIQRLIDDAPTLDRRALEQHLSLLVKQTPQENRERLLRKLLRRIESSREHRPSDVRLYLVTLAEAARQSPDSGLGRDADLRLQSLMRSREWQPLVADAAVMREARPKSLTEKVAAHSSPFEKYDSGIMPATATASSEGGIAAEFAATGAAVGTLPLGSPAAPVAASVPELYPDELGRSESGPPQLASPNASVRQETAATGGGTLAGGEDLQWQMHPAVLVWKAAGGPAAMTSWDRGAVARLGGALSGGLWKELLNPPPENLLAAIPAVQAGRSERPLLDGRVDDPCWGDFATLPIEAGQREPRVRFAYDAEFVYFALRGSFGHGDRARPVERRQRDSELESEVRAVLELDVDGDLLTAYELSVDARGHTRDTCDGFTHWQPIWYVATKLEGGVRTIEAAVRRLDLVGLPPVAGDRWRVRARIIAPDDAPSRMPLADPAGWQSLVFE